MLNSDDAELRLVAKASVEASSGATGGDLRPGVLKGMDASVCLGGVERDKQSGPADNRGEGRGRTGGDGTGDHSRGKS